MNLRNRVLQESDSREYKYINSKIAHLTKGLEIAFLHYKQTFTEALT